MGVRLTAPKKITLNNSALRQFTGVNTALQKITSKALRPKPQKRCARDLKSAAPETSKALRPKPEMRHA